MDNIQGYVEGLHTWGKRLTLAWGGNLDVLKINGDDDDMLMPSNLMNKFLIHPQQANGEYKF